MHDSVFSPAFGNRPSQLVGRATLVNDVMAGLSTQPGSRERALVMLGQRGAGKTVLLWEIADQARRKGYVVANPTTATEGMLERIIEKIQIDGERHTTRGPAKVSGASLSALGFSVGLQFTQETMETKSFYYKLRGLCKSLERLDRGVLVLVDELQANTPDLRQLVGAYQELVGEGLNIAMVLAGLPGAVSGTLNDKVLTFLNRAMRVSLGPLATGEVDAYYAGAFGSLGMSVPAELRREAADACEGSPYLMQLIGHYLTLYARNGVVDGTVLDDALMSARADFGRDVCQTTIAALSGKDVEFLREMAVDDGPSRVADVARRMDVTVDYAQKYRKRLIDAGVIEASGWGTVTFAVPYLRDWLRDGAGR